MPEAGPRDSDILTTFDRIADGYDAAPLRFFAFAADRAIDLLKPRPGQKVLDVAAGTGAVALAAAQAVAPGGRVTAIDRSEAMLARLESKARKFGLHHVDIHTMDAAALDFRRGYFDHTICSFGVAYLPDARAALHEWARVTRPGGGILFTTVAEMAMEPMAGKLRDALARVGIVLPSPRLDTAAQCEALLQSAGLADLSVTTVQVGYHLKDAAEWWQVVMHSTPRAFIDRLAPAPREALEREHGEEISRLVTANGLWLDVPVHFAQARVPA